MGAISNPPGYFRFSEGPGQSCFGEHTRLYHPACGTHLLGAPGSTIFWRLGETSYPGRRLGSDPPAGFLRAPKDILDGFWGEWAEVSGG
jgi:hypothetical protein